METKYGIWKPNEPRVHVSKLKLVHIATNLPTTYTLKGSETTLINQETAKKPNSMLQGLMKE